MKDEKAIADVLAAAREVQDFLWGPTDGSWGLSGWVRTFRKRIEKLDKLERDNPHVDVELRKRLLQIGALAVKFMTYVEEHGVPWDATVTQEVLDRSPAVSHVSISAWTRSNQQTPPIGQVVLGYRSGDFGIYRYQGTDDGCQTWYDQNEYLIDDPDEGNPTHWMPLPAKPGKGGK
jgi:hypothetical protein